MKNLFQKVKTAGDSLPARSSVSITLSMVEEVGELAKEVAILNDLSYKKPDSDGPFGESVDLLITVIDLIQTIKPDVTEEDIEKYADKKIAKWVTKTLEALNKKK